VPVRGKNARAAPVPRATFEAAPARAGTALAPGRRDVSAGGAGHGHGRALRGVADPLLAVLIAMLKSGQCYDANRRSRQVPDANAA